MSSDSYDVDGGWKDAPYLRKGEETISNFELRNSKILSVRFGIFKKLLHKESSVTKEWDS